MDFIKFKQLFVHKEDDFALQAKDGRYARQNRPITDRNIKDHLLGKQTIGLFQLKQEDTELWTVKWACADVDINKIIWSQPGYKIDDWITRLDEQAQLIKDRLALYNITGYVEDSAGKGRHVWIFFDQPIDAQLVKTVFERVLSTVNLVDPGMHIELFPKQSSADYGNLVKGPLGKHMKSGRMSYFIDPTDEIEFVTTKDLEEAGSDLNAIFQQCAAFANLQDKADKTGHLTNNERLVLASVFTNITDSNGTNIGRPYVEYRIYKKMDDYDAEKTKYYIEHGLGKEYKPYLCETVQSTKFDSICTKQCKLIGKSKSPVALYFRAKGDYQKEEELSIDSVSKADSIEKKGFGYYIKPDSTSKNKKLIQISDFYYRQDETLIIDDGIEQNKTFKGALINEKGEFPIELTSEEWSSDPKLSASIYNCLGNNILIDSISKIRDAMNKFAGGTTTTVKKIFGYNDELTKYYTPSIVISRDEIKKNDEMIIDLEKTDTAENLDMRILTDTQFEFVKNMIKEQLLQLNPPHITHSAFGHAMLPILSPFAFIDNDDSKYTLFLHGKTGGGKSFLLEKIQCLYGEFKTFGSWSGTANSVQKIGHYYKDAVYFVDDFKEKHVKDQYNQVLTVLQTYADGSARTRLSADSSLQKTYRIQGWFTTAGEDYTQGEASNVARMILIPVPKTPVQYDKGAILNKNMKLLCGYTPRYIQWILQQDKTDLSDKLLEYHKYFGKLIEGKDNAPRLARNMSLLMLSYEYAARFLWGEQEAQFYIKQERTYLEKLIKKMVTTASQESSAERFWVTLTELLAVGKVRFQLDPNVDEDKGSKVPIVGFLKKDQSYIIMGSAMKAVALALKESIPLGHSATAIIQELHEKGVLLDDKPSSVRFNKKTVRAVEMQPDAFDLELLEQ